jgi:acyl dehydratase
MPEATPRPRTGEAGHAAETLESRLLPGDGVTRRYAQASGDLNPIHLDDDAARAVGLPRAILHGMWTLAQAARTISAAGGGPLSLKLLSVQFRGYGFPDEELVIEGAGACAPDAPAIGGRLVGRVEFIARQGERVLLAGGVAELAPPCAVTPRS